MHPSLARRPEDRHRGAVFPSLEADSLPPPDWSDTVPACFRSEAFPEDLPDTGADLVLVLGQGGRPETRPAR